MELINKFWKYASSINKTNNIENVFIKWAKKEKISNDQFNILYTEIDNQITDMFRKGSISIKENGQTLTFDTIQEYKDFISNNQPEQEQPITNTVNELSKTEPQNTESKENESANSPNNQKNLAQQPIENKENVGQENNPSVEKSAISPEPNAAISENTESGNIGDTAEKEKNELKEGLLSILKK